MLGEVGMTRVDGVSQLFVKKNGAHIRLIVAKVIDDFLVAGITNDINDFLRELAQEFEFGNTAVGGDFRFNGCTSGMI